MSHLGEGTECQTRRSPRWRSISLLSASSAKGPIGRSLYDEMCFVAGKRLYRGLGYEELKDAGLDFTLAGLARTSRLTNEVTKRIFGEAALAAT